MAPDRNEPDDPAIDKYLENLVLEPKEAREPTMIRYAIERMKAINEVVYPGDKHLFADALLCELVRAAYGDKGNELTDIFDEMDKWYS